MIMMYILVFFIVILVCRMNVYEENVLGIYLYGEEEEYFKVNYNDWLYVGIYVCC